MWILTDVTGKVKEFKEDTTLTVGRRNTDLLLSNDNSISKIHAKILIKKTNDLQYKDGLRLIIMDAGSKYGTYLITKTDEFLRITAEGYKCCHNDKIRFGLQHHIFTVSYVAPKEYLVLISRIYDDDRNELAKILEKLNGVICDDWNPNCTHVTSPTVKLTEKISCALVCGLHIVTKDYWHAMLRSIQMKNQSLPNPEDFSPKIDSSILLNGKISLSPNSMRKVLFGDKIFIFFDNSQRETFQRMIELAGGSSVIYDETWKPQDCCKENVIVIQAPESSQVYQSQSFDYRSVHLRLSQEKLRRIPESEIPLAILYCSLEQYCNPNFKYDDLLKKTNDEKRTLSKILVPETQGNNFNVFKHPENSAKHLIIPESVSLTLPFDSEESSQPLKTRKRTAPASSSSSSSLSYVKRSIIIPESESTSTQELSQRTQNMQITNEPFASLPHQQETVNKNENQDRPRIIKVETVIPPFNPKSSMQIKNNAPISRKEKPIKNNKTDTPQASSSHDTYTESTSFPHYFTRNINNRLKCIIPLKRLTLDDMYEWKSNKL